MKKYVNSLFFLLSVVVICCKATTAFAATNTQDGVEVTLMTDKSEYSSDEGIITTLTVMNMNDTAITNVSLENLIPKGYKLADNSAAIKQIAILNAGESVTLTVTYVPNAVTDAGGTNDSNRTDDVDDDGDTQTITDKKAHLSPLIISRIRFHQYAFEIHLLVP